MTDPFLTARLTALEMRVAYQDQTIEDLNQAINSQWKELDQLKRQLARLSDELSAAQTDGSNLPEPPPPHY